MGDEQCLGLGVTLRLTDISASKIVFMIFLRL